MQPQPVGPITTKNSPRSKLSQDGASLMAYLLIIIGIVVLLSPLYQFPTLLENLADNPIHHYIVSFNPETKPIYFGETAITFPKEILRMFALTLGLMVLGVWIRIGSTLISAACDLLKIK